jgi:hypothetical protein
MVPLVNLRQHLDLVYHFRNPGCLPRDAFSFLPLPPGTDIPRMTLLPVVSARIRWASNLD